MTAGAILNSIANEGSISQRLKFSKKSILITAPFGIIPVELKDEAVVVKFPLPQASEVETVLQRLTQTPGGKVYLTKLGRQKLVQAALGLTASQGSEIGRNKFGWGKAQWHNYA